MNDNLKYKKPIILCFLITVGLICSSCITVSKYPSDSNDIATETGFSNNQTCVYGYWESNQTQHALALNLDGSHNRFQLNVTRYDGPTAYIEGTYKDNGDGTLTATVEVDDFDIKEGKSFTIVPTNDSVEVISDDTDFQDIVGKYPYAGDDFDDLEAIRP
ncbi:MAG: hypothetical protein IJT96_12165 [Lachnospiraceae bacterium]|nr:hypothetical protein [Lachnospiraceae bacterium]